MTRPPSAHDRAGRYGDGREEEEAESSEDGNTLETEVGRRHFLGPGLEGDDDGRDIDDFEPAEVEENTADSEEYWGPCAVRGCQR